MWAGRRTSKGKRSTRRDRANLLNPESLQARVSDLDPIRGSPYGPAASDSRTNRPDRREHLTACTKPFGESACITGGVHRRTHSSLCASWRASVLQIRQHRSCAPRTSFFRPVLDADSLPQCLFPVLRLMRIWPMPESVTPDRRVTRSQNHAILERHPN